MNASSSFNVKTQPGLQFVVQDGEGLDADFYAPVTTAAVPVVIAAHGRLSEPVTALPRGPEAGGISGAGGRRARGRTLLHEGTDRRDAQLRGLRRPAPAAVPE